MLTITGGRQLAIEARTADIEDRERREGRHEA
jgi:hypothetical protein